MSFTNASSYDTLWSSSKRFRERVPMIISASPDSLNVRTPLYIVHDRGPTVNGNKKKNWFVEIFLKTSRNKYKCRYLLPAVVEY